MQIAESLGDFRYVKLWRDGIVELLVQIAESLGDFRYRHGSDAANAGTVVQIAESLGDFRYSRTRNFNVDKALNNRLAEA